MSDWGDEVIRYKYDPLPEEPRHRKKAKKRHVKSDHKHEYEKVCIDAHTYSVTSDGRLPMYYVGTRCKVCGRLQDVRHSGFIGEPPKGMPLYEIDGIMGLFEKELGEGLRVR